jgi:ABC-type nitrate/sulfonate/bicarbonate transport system substrate-binding protein
MISKIAAVLIAVCSVSNLHLTHAETTKFIVAYASPAATFSPGWIAKREGIFSKYHLDVDMVLIQGASTYMPAAIENLDVAARQGGL